MRIANSFGLYLIIIMTALITVVPTRLTAITQLQEGLQKDDSATDNRRESIWVIGGMGSGTARFNYTFGIFREISSYAVGISYFYANGQYSEVKQDNLNRTIKNTLSSWRVSVGKQFLKGPLTLLILPRISYESTEIQNQESYYSPPILSFPGSWSWATQGRNKKSAFAIGFAMTGLYDQGSFFAYGLDFGFDYSSVATTYSVDLTLLFFIGSK